MRLQSVIGSEVRKVIAALFEILVARGALLAVPALLVNHHNGGQDGQLFNGKSDVGQIGNGTVAILEIKRVEKLLGFLLADLLERLLHGERRPRVLRHGVSLHFRINPMHGKHIDLRT